MGYQPKDVPPDEINNEESAPWSSFFKGVSVLSVMVFSVYVLSFYVPSWLLVVTPKSFDQAIGNLVHKRMTVISEKETSLKFKNIIKKVNGQLEKDLEHISFYEIKDESENAFAAPGDKVYFTSKFLEHAESENEILFVLGHELGHHKYRHPMKSLFTNFFSSFVTSLLGLQDSFSELAFQATSMRFSRSQETQADVYALNLVQKISGNTKGAFDFFRRMDKKYGHLNKFTDKVFSSHPLSKERVEYLEHICLQRFDKSSCL